MKIGFATGYKGIKESEFFNEITCISFATLYFQLTLKIKFHPTYFVMVK